MDDAPRVIVENRVGRVAIVAGDDGAVEVEAEKHAATKEDLAEIKLGVEKQGNAVTIKWDTNEPTIVNRSLDITIKAPKSSSIQVHTGNGAIAIAGFERGASAKSDVGPITVKGVGGDLALHSGNGAITADGTTGAVTAESGVGAVTIKGSGGSRKIQTGNGPIRLEGVEGTVDAESGVGAIEVSGRLSGRSRISTGNGRIVVTLPTDSKLAIDASTGNGAITNEFSLPVDGFVSRRSKGNLGDGSGGSLRLSTGTGNIELRKK